MSDAARLGQEHVHVEAGPNGRIGDRRSMMDGFEVSAVAGALTRTVARKRPTASGTGAVALRCGGSARLHAATDCRWCDPAIAGRIARVDELSQVLWGEPVALSY